MRTQDQDQSDSNLVETAVEKGMHIKTMKILERGRRKKSIVTVETEKTEQV